MPGRLTLHVPFPTSDTCDYNATIAHALGLPYELVIMSPTRRPFKIADKGEPIRAIFA